MGVMKPLRIFVVEDTEHDVAVIKRVFKKSGFPIEITWFPRAEGALEALRENASSFDIAVIDQALPGMQGIELCRTLMAEKTDLPLVLLTGAGSEQFAVEALKSGVDDYIIKDSEVHMEALPYVLRDVIGRHSEKKARIKAEVELRSAYDELTEKTVRLEKFHKITMGRETRIIELKEEVNSLLARLGEPARYKTTGGSVE